MTSEPNIPAAGARAFDARLGRSLLGDFELRREIGRGGMGTVFEAWQRSLERVVAVKIMAGHVSSTPSAVMRFRREAQAAAKLHHTNIVPIFAQGEDNGTYFYAMELIDGRSLNHIIADLRANAGVGVRESEADETVAIDRSAHPAQVDGKQQRAAAGSPITAAAVAVSSSDVHPATTRSSSSSALEPSPSASGSSIVVQASTVEHTSGEHFRFVALHLSEVADALEYAHARGVVHRDIKPHNLILGNDGRIRVSDFGLARMAEQPGVTLTGEVIGSPLYMAPEQIMHGPSKVDHRADIYSLGATMYEWLALHPPYPGETRERVISRVMTTEADPLRAHNPAIPIDLETICQKAIERDPQRRYQSAGELRDDLQRFVKHQPIQARRAGVMTRGRKFIERHKLGTLAAAALVLAVALTAALWRAKQTQERQFAVLNQERERTKQITEEFNQYKSLMDSLPINRLPLEIATPLRLAGQAVPMMQDLMGGGNRPPAPGAGLPANAPAIPPLTTVQRAAFEVYDSHRPRDLTVDPDETDIVSSFFVHALSFWPRDPNTAMQLVEQVLIYRPDDYEARHYHAALAAVLGRPADVTKDAERMIGFRPTGAIGYVWRGVGYLLQNNQQSSLAELHRAIELDPQFPWARVFHGLNLVQLGRWQDAIADLTAALAVAPRNVVALLARADAHRELGNFAPAAEDLSRVLDVEPDNFDALAKRCESYILLGNHERSAGDFNEVLRLAGQDPSRMLRIAILTAKYARMTGGAVPPVPVVVPVEPAPPAAVPPPPPIAPARTGAERPSDPPSAPQAVASPRAQRPHVAFPWP